MERQIERRDFTLMVCTEAYRRRFTEDEPAGVGRGVVWEARILRNLLYEDSGRHGRIVPVLLEPGDRAFVPTVFRGHFYDLSDERGFESLLRHLLREPGAEAGALGSQGSRWTAFERPWSVPDALRTAYFTGREELLERLHAQLTERGRAVLCGLGGVGKTQTAIEYAARHRADYPDGVFWINAETVSGLTSGFVGVAAALHLPAAGASDQEEALKAVMAWLNGTHGWLLILDNVDERGQVRRFVPERGNGHVLITSRESIFQELGISRAFDVTDLRDAEALDFLLARTGCEDATPIDRAAAAELATELGNLPLALEQAAAYIVETGADFAAYLNAFRKRRVTLLEKAGGLVSHDTVAFTWAANFEAVERASPAAADVLRISALLAPDAIPFELFLDAADALGDSIAAALADPDDLAMAELLRPLTRYSLTRSDAALRTFGVHRLVQEIVRGSMPQPDRQAFVGRAVCALDVAFPEVEFARWAQCERLVPHVASIAEWAESAGVQPEAAGRVLTKTGRYLHARGRYAEAQSITERALAIRERALGADHPDVAVSLNELSVVHWYQGRFAEAQPLSERALAIRERALGPDHPDVAASLNNLAILNSNQGRYAVAAPLYERALAIRERAHGADHPAVANSLSNLANDYREQGRYAQAQPLHERALAIRERLLNPDHPDIAGSLDNLGETYVKQGRYADARALFERALAIRDRVLGPDHPERAFTLDSLAGIATHLGDYAEAEALFERARAIRERALGPDHPAVADSLAGLANLHVRRARYAEADALLARALTIRERALVPVHIAATLAVLASLRTKQDRPAEAIALYERALAVKERVFGADHPELAELHAAIDALRRNIDNAAGA